MAILGVLLGITMAAVIALALEGRRRTNDLASLFQETWDKLEEAEASIAVLEKRDKRRALVGEAEATPGHPASASAPVSGIGRVRRQWNEDAPAVEVKKK